MDKGVVKNSQYSSFEIPFRVIDKISFDLYNQGEASKFLWFLSVSLFMISKTIKRRLELCERVDFRFYLFSWY